jgi:putative salt-induced outer membrane protein YdiY
MTTRGFRACVAAAAALLVAAAPVPAEILNTLRGFGDEAPGWSGDLGTFFSASGGNTEKTALTGAGSVQLLTGRQRWRLMADGTLERTDGDDTERNSVVHLRQNVQLNDPFATIAFAQHQYDRFQRLESRFLLGAGMRWDAVRAEHVHVSVGASPMLEVEKEEGTDALARGRMSTFLSVLGNVDERTSVDVIAFVQPAMAELADTRAVATASLRVKMGGGIALQVSSRVQYDAEPAPDVKDTDWKVQTGLTWSL